MASDVSHLLTLFTFSHLPPPLRSVSEPFAELARQIAERAASPEATVALRKLLEAKDAAVRDTVIAMRNATADGLVCAIKEGCPTHRACVGLGRCQREAQG